MVRLLWLALLFATPAVGQPVPGRDDPAFALAFARALQGDDPTALDDIHAAAEAGNAAAILALPNVTNWLLYHGTMREVRRYRQVNGQPLVDLIASTSPIAAIWHGWKPEQDMSDTLVRIAGLHGAGETGKADFLMFMWVNHTGALGSIPSVITEDAASAYVTAITVGQRVTSIPDAFAKDWLIRLLREDRIEGWMALHRVSTRDDPAERTISIAEAIASAGVPAEVAVQRLDDARRIWQSIEGGPLPRPLDEAALFIRELGQRPEYLPLRTVCAASCPADPASCMTAYVQGFGAMSHPMEFSVPLVMLIPRETFFATPRGTALFVRYGLERLPKGGYRDDALAAVRQTSSCLAQVVADAPD